MGPGACLPSRMLGFMQCPAMPIQEKALTKFPRALAERRDQVRVSRGFVQCNARPLICCGRRSPSSPRALPSGGTRCVPPGPSNWAMQDSLHALHTGVGWLPALMLPPIHQLTLTCFQARHSSLSMMRIHCRAWLAFSDQPAILWRALANGRPASDAAAVPMHTIDLQSPCSVQTARKSLCLGSWRPVIMQQSAVLVVCSTEASRLLRSSASRYVWRGDVGCKGGSQSYSEPRSPNSFPSFLDPEP